ncbi:MAG: LEA type 2 family protein [Pseudomonadales bacterium]|jgi:LEA14-like dessication related protein|nr:LEA type 2 family protein [Pseudomonadales bacterium]
MREPEIHRIRKRRGPHPALRVPALVLMLLLGSCANLGELAGFDEPDVELLGLEPLPVRGMEARFLVRLRVVNPNPVPLLLDGMAFDLFLRDSKVLSGVSNEGLDVGAYSESVANVEVAAGMLGSLSLLRDLMTDPGDGSIPYRLDTKLSLQGIRRAIRIDREGVFSLGGAASARGR